MKATTKERVICKVCAAEALVKQQTEVKDAKRRNYRKHFHQIQLFHIKK